MTNVPTSLDSLPSALGSWPSTSSTRAAIDYIEANEPEYLVNHSVRSYFYASMFAKAQGLRTGEHYSDELLFIGVILHDIGLTEQANGTQRFEVDGADAAAAFVRNQGLGDSAAEIVWDAVALHTSPGIANRKRAEVALAHAGIGADIFELGSENLDEEVLEAAVARYPRLNLRRTLTRAVADQIVHQPTKFVPASFPAETVHFEHPHLPFPSLEALLAGSRWNE